MDTTSAQLPGIPNFRDIGGHLTRDGWRTRSGLLYRSVALSRADEADVERLADLGIDTVFDLRTRMERDRHPDRLPAGMELVALDVLADSGEADPAALFELMLDPPRASAEMANGETERFYVASYRDMVKLPSARAAYRQLYLALARQDDGAALVHCTTGKDRTGWAVAALLLWLGVRADAVMREYLVSDAEVRRAFRPAIDDFVARGGDREVFEPLMGVRPSYLVAAIDAMHAEYASVEAYFSDGLGLDAATLARLRARFLERA
jgi:protein-tyrosine phosphatase